MSTTKMIFFVNTPARYRLHLKFYHNIVRRYYLSHLTGTISFFDTKCQKTGVKNCLAPLPRAIVALDMAIRWC